MGDAAYQQLLPTLGVTTNGGGGPPERDPEMRLLTTGKSVTTVRVAVGAKPVGPAERCKVYGAVDGIDINPTAVGLMKERLRAWRTPTSR